MTRSKSYRQLPLLSEIIVFPLFLFGAFMHVVTPSQFQPTVAALAGGGFFAFLLLPPAMVGSILFLLETTGLWPGVSSLFIIWIGIPFAISYMVQILILDKLHLEVEHSSLIPPRNAIERASAAFFESARNYFPLTCVPWSENASLPPSQQYVFAVHPHGVHCPPLIMMTTPGGPFDVLFPGLVGHSLSGLAATVLFKMPLIRELFIYMGYVDANRKTATKVLESGRSLFICTGGEEESLLTVKGKDIVVLKKRKGFVRLALTHNAALVPIFGFGNTDSYKTYGFLMKQRRWLQKHFGIAVPIYHGRWWIPLPYKSPIRVVVGEPIPTPPPTGEPPSEALVSEYHAKYMAALAELHTKHVNDGRRLEIR